MFFACFISARVPSLCTLYIHFVASISQGPHSNCFLIYGALFRPDSDLFRLAVASSYHPAWQTDCLSSHRGKTIHCPACQTVEFSVYETM